MYKPTKTIETSSLFTIEIIIMPDSTTKYNSHKTDRTKHETKSRIEQPQVLLKNDNYVPSASERSAVKENYGECV